jgi:prophage maintenance system killer protein
MPENTKGEIIIYKDREKPRLKVKVSNQTIWLNQAQIAELFKTKRPAITKHLKNIFKSGELKEKSVCSFLEHTAPDGKNYRVKYYNLDAIISVGYRVNSSKATQFRIWATQKLKDLLVKGFVVNEKKLKEYEAKVKELKQAEKIFRQALESRRTEGFEKDLLSIITDYLNAWVLLNEYDKNELKIENVTTKKISYLEYVRVIDSVERFKQRLMQSGQASHLFGKQTGNKLEALLNAVRQTVNKKDAYASLEEKAAHIFYFTIKDHPFVDGNKRIGSLLFLLFLIENRHLYNRRGERKINDAALAALALLVAESKPEQKQAMIRLIVNLINK